MHIVQAKRNKGVHYQHKVKCTIIFYNERIYLVWLFPWTFSTWLLIYSYFPPQMSHFLHVWSENTWPFRACALQNTALHWSHGFADWFWLCLLRFCFVENSFLQWEHWKSGFPWFAFTWADRALLEQKVSSHSSQEYLTFLSCAPKLDLKLNTLCI